ncbi:GRB2-associated-binding protein 2 [Sciurus carolinensis]|uniref:GRB2-associated-binding protein 2 n=1 Tax=Sciurus carolinensis TaxID=30640 RepID=A0AA41MSY3_SCICA|nr:GRB2-associated-binding protein 2 [Sciurus carolinensis]
MASKSHTTGSPTDSETDSEDPYIFMPHIKTPLSVFHIPKTSMMGESHSTGAAAAPGSKAMTTLCHPHKPSEVETPQQNCPSQNPAVRKKNRSVSFAATMPCHRDYQAVDSNHHHQAFFPEAFKYPPRDTQNAGPSAQSRSLGISFQQPEETDAGHLNEDGHDENYRPMSILPSILLAMERADLVRGSEIQPPAVDHSFKPGHKAKPAALDPCGIIIGQPSPKLPRAIHPGHLFPLKRTTTLRWTEKRPRLCSAPCGTGQLWDSTQPFQGQKAMTQSQSHSSHLLLCLHPPSANSASTSET